MLKPKNQKLAGGRYKYMLFIVNLRVVTEPEDLNINDVIHNRDIK